MRHENNNACKCKATRTVSWPLEPCTLKTEAFRALGPLTLSSGTLDGLTIKAVASRAQSSQGARSQARPGSAAVEPPVVDVTAGGAAALVGCEVVGGGLRVGRGCAARIERCRVSCPNGAGIELNGTADGCTVSECEVDACGGPGILVRRQAHARLAAM